MYNRGSEIDMEALKAFLEDAVNKVKTQENPDVLGDVKKVFKKSVPFTLRMYVAGFSGEEHKIPERKATHKGTKAIQS